MSESPLALFMFFMPKTAWRKIARETNRYHTQQLPETVRRLVEKQKDTPNAKAVNQIWEQEAKKKEVQPHELMTCLGLLIARMLCPHKQRFTDHWATTSSGAVPAGTFGRWMPRNRFQHIMRYLHFTNNADYRSKTDRAWKVRSVHDVLQRTFRQGYEKPPVVAFDEAVIPSRSRYNNTRQVNKDKPHKWGTKLFLTCCAKTAYCLRMEIYCGKDQHETELGVAGEREASADPNTGPAAVMRNINEVLLPVPGAHHVIVTDRFYTSVQLALQLMHRRVYSLGTIMSSRIGYCTEITEKNHQRPAGIQRGSSKFAVSKICPEMIACLWWDSRPVQLLCTGASRTEETCDRRLPGGRKLTIPCPSMARDYQRWMGGVDIHDQLRLQRYSLQMAMKFKKYYKAIFLGLVDMSIVNAYVVYREAQKARGERPIGQAQFLRLLHCQLLEMTAADFVETTGGSPVGGTGSMTAHLYRPVSSGHEPLQCPDFQIVNGIRKRRQRQCKVCSILKQTRLERAATRSYCGACSNGTARVYLCDRVRQRESYKGLTCHQIWHNCWDNGRNLPKPKVGRGIQMRRAGRALGKRKRRHRTSEADEEEDVDEEGTEEDVDGGAPASQRGVVQEDGSDGEGEEV